MKLAFESEKKFKEGAKKENGGVKITMEVAENFETRNMTNQLNKFLLLMWKNWTLIKRRPVLTAFEIIFPVLICLILLFLRIVIKVKEEDLVVYPEFRVKDLDKFCLQEFVVTYSPSSPLLDEVITSVFSELCPYSSLIVPQTYESSDALNEDINSNEDVSQGLFAAIEFNDDLLGISDRMDLVPNVEITIRLPTMLMGKKYDWYTDVLFQHFQFPGPRSDGNVTYGGAPGYMERGFLALQQTLTFALLGEPPKTEIVINRFSYPPHLKDNFYSTGIEQLICLLIIIIFSYNFVNTIRVISTEKENQLKESMKIMGLPGWLHWTAWYTRSFIILLLVVIVIIILTTVKLAQVPIFTYSDPTVLFVFLLLFACCTISLSFLISVFFSSANTATTGGCLIYFITYLIWINIIESSKIVSLSTALASSLLSNAAVSFGISIILKFEGVQEGVQWSNLWARSSPDSDVTFAAILLMMLLDVFLYLVLALYIEAIFPGEYGMPQPWYFPVTRAYWCNTPVETKVHDKMTQTTGTFFESFSGLLPIGIQLQNVSKVFGINTVVNHLNLNMYQGHITVLLGHNGAGKTTLMSMITGMFPPSSGTILVNGYDVRTNVKKVRDSMGLCLQHNVLFDTLTVYEHLYFFGKLKGLSSSVIQAEINMYIGLLELEDKRHARSSSLSGGMKRKLCVGMALCGNSKVVMLDEPTSGLDPSARRIIWNLLEKQKEGRTILLTTHFMDEADLLGDRIAIMTGGVLQCCGTSFFLKKKFGTGYYLVMDIKPRAVPYNITALLKKYIPQIQVYSFVGSELTYQLPETESGRFEIILRDLEQNMSSLGVQNYGVSLATLEEVFMKVGADFDNSSSKVHNQNVGRTSVTVDANSELPKQYLNGAALMKNQFIAVVLKKMLSSWRMWYLMLLQFILPSVLIVLIVLIMRNFNPPPRLPPLKISLDLYDSPVILLDGAGRYYQSYKDMLSKYNVKEVSNVTETILSETTKSPTNVKRYYLAGASFNKTTSKAWFNGNPYHTTALSLSLVLNMLFKESRGKDSSISFTNYPLPISLESQVGTVSNNRNELMGGTRL